jgi:hypothetical protein
LSTEPTVTPRIRTSEPSDIPTAVGKVAVMLVRPNPVTARKITVTAATTTTSSSPTNEYGIFLCIS